jgi:hypothetical protein
VIVACGLADVDSGKNDEMMEKSGGIPLAE